VVTEHQPAAQRAPRDLRRHLHSRERRSHSYFFGLGSTSPVDTGGGGHAFSRPVSTAGDISWGVPVRRGGTSERGSAGTSALTGSVPARGKSLEPPWVVPASVRAFGSSSAPATPRIPSPATSTRRMMALVHVDVCLCTLIPLSLTDLRDHEPDEVQARHVHPLYRMQAARLIARPK
jgi:hypothetical protein